MENNGPDLLGASSSEQYCCEVYYHCVPITPISQQGCQVVDGESFYCYSTQPLKGYTTQYHLQMQWSHGKFCIERDFHWLKKSKSAERTKRGGTHKLNYIMSIKQFLTEAWGSLFS